MGSIREIVRKDGIKTYHAEVRLRGSVPQRATFRNRSLAKKWVQDTESAIRDGRHFKTVEARRHTVGEMIDRFVSQWLPKYPHRIKKQTALLMWWKEKCGHLLLSDFTPSVIAGCRDQLLNETTYRGDLRSPSTVNRYLSAIGIALTIAMKEWGWIEDSPMRKVTKPKENEGRDRVLKNDEKQRLLQECRNSSNINLYPIVVLAMLTGMRSGEIVNLKWGDIDFDACRITLHKTKNGDKRYLPITSQIEAVFRDHSTFGSPSDSFVFKSNRNLLENRPVSIRHAFESAVEKAGIIDFRFHDLRHQAATEMAEAQATQGELMAILGHRSPHMTRRYAHYSQGHLKTVLERRTNNLQRLESNEK